MGHREDVWEKPAFQSLVIGALNWASGRIDLDASSNIATATPEAEVEKKAPSNG